MVDKGGKANRFEKIFDPVAREYGTTVAELSIVVTLVIGTFGFDNYFKANVWVMSCILWLGLLYLFRYQVKFSVGSAGLVALFWLLCFIALGIVLFKMPSFVEFIDYDLERRKTALSAYSAFALTIPIGIVLLSYRRQQLTKGLLFPRQITDAIEKQIYSSAFYKKDLYYEVDFAEPGKDGTVEIVTTMSYQVTNRTDEDKQWTTAFTTLDRLSEVKSLKIGSETVDSQNFKNFKTARGHEISRNVPANSFIKIEFSVATIYGVSDSELFTTYNLATDITVAVKEVGGLDFRYENLYDESDEVILLKQVKGRTVTKLHKGVLPFEGVRITWKKREGG